MNSISNVGTPQSNQLTVNLLRAPSDKIVGLKFRTTDTIEQVFERVTEVLDVSREHIADLAFGIQGRIYCTQQNNLDGKFIEELHQCSKEKFKVLLLMWKNDKVEFARDKTLSDYYFPEIEIKKYDAKRYF